jgi:diaminopimelate decarboxylase
MHHFQYRNGTLHAEDVPVAELAERHGTPLYVYSRATLEDHFKRLDAALDPVDHLICYAMKANSNLGVLRVLAAMGSGFDIVSAGELYRVIRAGGDPGRCTFAGVGKTRSEIEYALEQGIYSFNVESEDELLFLDEVAAAHGVVAPVALRVNPNVKADTHAKITTGTYENKFGIAFEEIPSLYARAAKLGNLRLRGVQTHIGSQITEVSPFIAAVEKLVPLVAKLKADFGIEFFDIGGGVGIVYDPALASGAPEWWSRQGVPLTPREYCAHLLPLVQGLGLRILVEPGRFIVGNAGILVSEVLYVKQTGAKRFVIVDAAMNDLIRPAFYDSFHEIIAVDRASAGALVSTDVVGPICESGDVFCHDRELPSFRRGDRVAFLSAGAYGFTMASNYNSRPRAAEVLVSGGNAQVVRRRETFEDLVRGEE